MIRIECTHDDSKETLDALNKKLKAYYQSYQRFFNALGVHYTSSTMILRKLPFLFNHCCLKYTHK